MNYAFSLLKKNTVSSRGINTFLNGKNKDITVLKKTGSTNSDLKNLARNGAKEGAILITEHQTEGRGRKGRTFFSPKGCGLYFSMLLTPNLAPEDAVLITVLAALSVRRAIYKVFSIDTKIKWVNDIYYNDKKLCGILTEAVTEKDSHKLNYAILGIGINLKTPKGGYPEEFAFKTTNLSEMVSSFPTDYKNRLIAEFILEFDALYQNFDKKACIEEYKNASCILERKIEILSGSKKEFAVATDIDENANLIVSTEDGETLVLNSGDVSICF